MKKTQRFSCAVLLILALLLAYAVPCMASGVGEVWDGMNAWNFARGTGTKEDPYIISRGAELSLLASNVYRGVSTYEGKYFRLSHDILLNDVSQYVNWNDDAAPENIWQPIGRNAERPFSGHFDGNGYAIMGCYVATLTDTVQDDYCGLFGYVAGATITNLTVKQGYIHARDYAGGVVGYAENTTLTRCSCADTVLRGTENTGGIVGGIAGNSTVKECDNHASVYCAGSNCGGVVGHKVDGAILECMNTGTVLTESITAGGIVGHQLAGTVERCTNRGVVSGTDTWKGMNVGGIAGTNGDLSDKNPAKAEVLNCCNTGAICTECGFMTIGGIAGGVASNGIVSCCFSSGEVGGMMSKGGIAGSKYSGGTVTDCYYAVAVSGGTDEGKLLTGEEVTLEASFTGFDFTAVWTMGEKHPVLQALKEPATCTHIDADCNGFCDYCLTLWGDADMNGSLSAEDITAFARCLAHIENLSTNSILCDMNYSGNLDSADLTLLARLVARQNTPQQTEE